MTTTHECDHVTDTDNPEGELCRKSAAQSVTYRHEWWSGFNTIYLCQKHAPQHRAAMDEDPGFTIVRTEDLIASRDVNAAQTTNTEPVPFAELGACGALESQRHDAYCPVHNNLHVLLVPKNVKDIAERYRGELSRTYVDTDGLLCHELKFPDMNRAMGFAGVVRYDARDVELMDSVHSLHEPVELFLSTYVLPWCDR